MTPPIDITQIIDLCFTAQFLVYGYMAFALYPYDDYAVAQRIKHAVSRQYVRTRRMLGMSYILLGIAAICGLHPALSVTDGGWQSPLVPTCLTLFFVSHARMLLSLCSWEPINRKTHLLCLLPLPVLCVLYGAFPAEGDVFAILQSVHLVLLIGYYTPLFYKAFEQLNRCCWDAVNETPDEIAEDYDCLPESMPWIGRRYKGLLIITLLGLFAYFLPLGWSSYIVAVLYVGYLFWFFYWVFQRFPRYSRTLFFYINEEDR